jgi:(E)-4-hydroxy-3-methylbut-2-enyl-diphosphate synthase
VGNGKGVIFRNGEIVRHVVEAEMVDALLEEVEQWEKDHTTVGKPVSASNGHGRKRLPVVAGG